MSSGEVEKWLGRSRQDSTTLTSSSISTHSSHDREDQRIDYGPDTFLTPTVSHASQPPISRRVTSIQTTGTSDPNFEVDWEGAEDENNPKNWPTWYKGAVIFGVSFSTVTVVAYSTSYTSGLVEMMDEFGVTSEAIATLGVTAYLIGLAVGSLLLAPLSEVYGRKPAYIGGMIFFTLMLVPSALAQSMAGIIVIRFFGAIGGSAMIANAPGTIADIANEEYQALMFSIWSIGPLNGPVVGPVIGGYTAQYLGWRWVNWVVMCMAGVSLVVVFSIKETYTPALLRRKAAKLRKETDDPRWWCRYDERVSFSELMKTNLSRPFVMAVTEKICIFWNAYIAIVYGILYLCFVAYPIVFAERGFSTSEIGLSFIGIGIGTMIAIMSEPLIRKIINSHRKDPKTNKVPPEAAVGIICIGAILIPTGELWFAWTCLPASIHWAVPIAAGIPFGMGNTAVFIYSANYLAHSYGIYAASAMAGNSVVRSILGGTLPVVGAAMYKTLNAHWAGTLLGLLEVAIIPIPIVFYLYGARIREQSALIRQMQEDRERAEQKRSKKQGRRSKATDTGGDAAGEAAREGKETGLANVPPVRAYPSDKQTWRAISAERELDRLAGLDDIERQISATTSAVVR